MLVGDLNVHKPLCGSKRTGTKDRILEKLLDEFDLLYIIEKQKLYCRFYIRCKSNIDLSLMNIIIALEYMWTKKYNPIGN